jgi:hypothetical protein
VEQQVQAVVEVAVEALVMLLRQLGVMEVMLGYMEVVVELAVVVR